MSGPGLRHLALGTLTAARVKQMLGEGETLFFEHKKDMRKGEGFQIAKAAASFANTLGGWILVGVERGQIRPDWQPPRAEFVDAVRQRLEGQVDPMPSFAARVMRVDGRKVGVVRIYESADTPHILKDGSVVVREPAQDSRLRKLGVYEPTPIRSHYELVQLAKGGQEARRAAESHFSEGHLPVADAMLGIRWTTAATSGRTFRTVHSDVPALVVRLAPLTTTSRWPEWAVDEGASRQLTQTVEELLDDPVKTSDPEPFARGVAVEAAETQQREWKPGASKHVTRRAVAVADAGGLVGIRIAFQLHQASGLTHYQRSLTFDEIQGQIRTVLARLARTLFEAEHLGRFAAHAYWLRIGDLYRIDPDLPNEGRYPPAIPLGGDLTVTSAKGDPDENALSKRWAVEVLRSCGIAAWGAGS